MKTGFFWQSLRREERCRKCLVCKILNVAFPQLMSKFYFTRGAGK